jgi:hypothetical protein
MFLKRRRYKKHCVVFQRCQLYWKVESVKMSGEEAIVSLGEEDIYRQWREVEMKILWLLENDGGRNYEKRLQLLRKVQHLLYEDPRDAFLRDYYKEEVEWLLEQLNEEERFYV